MSKVLNCHALDVFVKGPWTSKLIYPFPKRAQYSDNFDTNIGTQHFVYTEKFAFEIDDLQK